MRVLLAASGSVAAIKVPELARQLLSHGFEVTVVATAPAAHFFTSADLPSGVQLYGALPCALGLHSLACTA